MILEHNTLNLFDKKVFEKVLVTTPYGNANHLDNEACFLYFTEGRNNHYSEEDHLHMRAHEGVLMKCGNYLYNVTPDKDTGRCGLIAIHFYPDVLKKVYENKVPDFLKKKNHVSYNSNMALVKSTELIAKYIESLSFFFENPNLVDEELLILKIKEIILLLSKINAPAIIEIMYNLFSPRSVSFKDVIETHLFSPLSLNDLAELTNCSLATFKREFRKEYNDSPANYIKNRRLGKAAELLAISDKRISAIAHDCLFGDTAHFSSAFKSKYQLSPSEYRLSQSQK